MCSSDERTSEVEMGYVRASVFGVWPGCRGCLWRTRGERVVVFAERLIELLDRRLNHALTRPWAISVISKWIYAGLSLLGKCEEIGGCGGLFAPVRLVAGDGRSIGL